MKILVLKEHDPLERRVALSPEVVAKMSARGWDVLVDKGAGVGAHIQDKAFQASGATIVTESAKAYEGVNVVVGVGAPSTSQVAHFPAECSFIGMLGEASQNTLSLMGERKMQAFCLQRLPRISRAQSMDVLSSQSTIAGYAAMMLAGVHASRLFPLLMTAGGTLPAARALVLGAGVAGLQAIATARRLGARVFAYDVRAEVAEQIQSLGAQFVDIPLTSEEGASSGGYAKGLSKAAEDKQRSVLSEVMKDMDVVVTTALVMGKTAPTLLTREMVSLLKPGAVVVDMAAPMGGNCVLTKAGETIVHDDVTIVGPTHLPSQYAYDASALYARNIFAFMGVLWDEKGQQRTEIDQDVVEPTRILSDKVVKVSKPSSAKDKK
jgi:NAD(P) transhydrogenase subunit alpha